MENGNHHVPRWLYDPGEGRHKHRWNRDEAGFDPSGKGPVGKCPNTLTRDVAQQLLNDGFEVWEEGDAFPSRIYNVYQGVVYEAVPTEPGRSYHGYPWRGDKGMGAGLPPLIRKKLENRALLRGESREFKKWMKKFGGP